MASFRKATRPRRLIRKQEVLHRTGYSHTTIWRLEKAGLFPLRVQLSPMAVGWFEDEVDQWIASRIRRGGKKTVGLVAERSPSSRTRGATAGARPDTTPRIVEILGGSAPP